MSRRTFSRIVKESSSAGSYSGVDLSTAVSRVVVSRARDFENFEKDCRGFDEDCRDLSYIPLYESMGNEMDSAKKCLDKMTFSDMVELVAIARDLDEEEKRSLKSNFIEELSLGIHALASLVYKKERG